MKKYLIIIGGGILQVPLIKQAIEMNFIPIVFDYDENAPGFKIDEVIKIPVSTQDVEKATYEALRLSKKYNIAGVLTSGTDVSQTVASIADKLNLIGNTIEVSINTTDKIRMRKVLKQAGINQPDFFEINSLNDFLTIFEKMKNGEIFKNGAVIKPALNMGPRGVRYLDKETQNPESIYNFAYKASKNKKVILEEYIEAYELSIDALVQDGEIYITGVADRFIQPPPFFVEKGHFMPSLLDKKLVDAGIDVFIKGIKTLKIKNGAAKGDIRVRYEKDIKTGKKIAKGYVGEIASRLSGGFMSTHTFPYSSGINLMENIIKIHTNQKIVKPENKWNY